MRSGLSGIFGLGLFLVSACPAPALEPSELRGKIEEAFALYNAPVIGDAKVYLLESVDVRAQGDGFRVTLSELGFLLDPVEQASLIVGTTSFTMTPEGEAGGEPLFRVSDVDLPKRWLVKEGRETSNVINFGALHFEGLWSFALLTTIAGELSAGQISFETPDGEPMALIKSLKGTMDSKPSGAGRYDLGGNFQLEGASVRDDEFSFGLASLEATATMPDYDLAEMARSWRTMARASQGPGADQDVFGDFFSRIFSSSLNSRFKISLKGMEGVQTETEDTFQIGSIDIGYGITGLSDSLAVLDFTLDQTGFSLAGPSIQGDRFANVLLPADGRVTLVMEGFPLRTFLELARPVVQEAAAAEATGQTAPGLPDGLAEEMGLKLLDALAEAGMSLDLSGTRFASPHTEVTLTGGLLVDSAAAFGARGSMLIEAAGFDALVKLAQDSMNDPDPEVRETAMGAIGFLGMLKTYADRDASNPQRPVDRFKVVLGADGGVAINGQPLFPPRPAQ